MIADATKIPVYDSQTLADICIIEVGGTIGDIESMHFIEAIRQLSFENTNDSFCFIHVSLVTDMTTSGELKTKPTQHSVMRLREIGLSPDVILCRSETSIAKSVKEKIALFCNVNAAHVIEGRDVNSIYEVPLLLDKQKVGQLILERLELSGTPNVSALKEFIEHYKNPTHTLNVAMCGKYTELPDAYKSVLESFIHAGIENKSRVNIIWVSTEDLKSLDHCEDIFNSVDGILLLPGFGKRGSEGKILACQYARENKVPFLGICLGLQCAVIEFARNICNMKNANSTEFNSKTPYPVIDLMESQRMVKRKGGTMRLGAYECQLKTGTKTYKEYKTKKISERHRHRWEVNNRYRSKLEKNGLIISGNNTELNLVEIVELKDHPWFVGCQFHPELKSRVLKAHPLFRGFIGASLVYNRNKK